MKVKTSTFVRIKPPKYRIGRYRLNEYELRTFMAEVCEGRHDVGTGITVTDDKGMTATLLPNGRLSNNLYGTDICSLATLRLIREIRRSTEL